jgi:lipopolysaccharide/colanic/teichoic acid biosynthesis glycosyltransferase
MKRVLDISAAVVGLMVLGIPMLVVALLIRWDSPGPILYRARRIGCRGAIFTMYKFRTMVTDAARYGSAITAQADPRITRVGRWLRKARIDEWPQLVNVLRGEMSLVGPRPETPECLPYYDQRQREVLQVRPGITGLTQICYQDEESLLGKENTFENYVTRLLPRKLELDRVYMQKQTVWIDLIIVWSTLNPHAEGLKRRVAAEHPDLVMLAPTTAYNRSS